MADLLLEHEQTKLTGIVSGTDSVHAQRRIELKDSSSRRSSRNWAV